MNGISAQGKGAPASKFDRFNKPLRAFCGGIQAVPQPVHHLMMETVCLNRLTVEYPGGHAVFFQFYGVGKPGLVKKSGTPMIGTATLKPPPIMAVKTFSRNPAGIFNEDELGQLSLDTEDLPGIKWGKKKTGEILIMVEIHTISMIAKTPGICVSDIAKKWNRTLEAASRNVDRLQAAVGHIPRQGHVTEPHIVKALYVVQFSIHGTAVLHGEDGGHFSLLPGGYGRPLRF